MALCSEHGPKKSQVPGPNEAYCFYGINAPVGYSVETHVSLRPMEICCYVRVSNTIVGASQMVSQHGFVSLKNPFDQGEYLVMTRFEGHSAKIHQYLLVIC